MTDVSKARDDQPGGRHVSKDAYVLPLYQKPTYTVIYDKYVNIRDNPTNIGPSYNIGEWGIKASAS